MANNSNDEIKVIEGNDLISDSMKKINDNFQLLFDKDKRDKANWEKYINQVKEEIHSLEETINLKNFEIGRQIELVDGKFDTIPTIDNVQREISNAISDTESILGQAIKSLAGRVIDNSMNDYAKTVDVNSKLNNYVTSTTFTDYKSNAKNKEADINVIAANSKFYMVEHGGEKYLVWVGDDEHLANSRSPYKSLSGYYNSLENKEDYNLSDPDDLKAFIALCETKFKTVSTEMAGFSAKVAEDMAELDIITQVSGDNGNNIISAIVTKANSSGSEIKLNADHIYVGGNHDLDIESGGSLNIKSGGGLTISNGGDLKINSGGKFEVSSSNFNIDSEGNVTISGAITATTLTIAPNSSAASQFNSLVQSAGSGVWAALGDIPDKISELTNDTGFITNSALDDYTTTSTLNNTLSTYVQTTTFGTTLENYATKSDLSTVTSGYDTWLTKAFGKTQISGGLILTGNVVAVDANNNPTAGMMGATSSGHDLRFFAGSADSSSASFRVYEDGELWATNAHITGAIEATSLTIASNSSATSQFNSLVQGAVSNAGYINTSTLTSTLSNYTTSSVLTSVLSNYTTATALGYTLSNYATKSDLSTVASYPDGWLTRAFSKTVINGGLLLTGNVFAADTDNNPTAGMMGATTPDNDLRFFAGSADSSIAPFRVYEDGSFYASKAHLSGVIKYNFLRITQDNWENYKRKLGEKNGVPYYTINLNNTGKNVEIAYLPFVPGGIGLTFDVNTPTITEDMVGTEINIINLIPKSTITIGHNFRDFTVEGYPYTNAAIIKPDNSQSSGFVGGNTTGRVGFLECMTLMAIEIPTYEPETSYNICNDCGYNNGGLFTGGVCPDCGSTNIRTETRGGGTRFAWIRTDKYIT